MTTKRVRYYVQLWPGWENAEYIPGASSSIYSPSIHPGHKLISFEVELPLIPDDAIQAITVTEEGGAK